MDAPLPVQRQSATAARGLCLSACHCLPLDLCRHRLHRGSLLSRTHALILHLYHPFRACSVPSAFLLLLPSPSAMSSSSASAGTSARDIASNFFSAYFKTTSKTIQVRRGRGMNECVTGCADWCVLQEWLCAC